jgi:hypothetical protein
LSILSDLFNPPPAPRDNSARVARNQERARRRRINVGEGAITRTFDRTFNPAYFSDFRNDYLGYYNPQVDEQFGDARQALRYDAARKGTLNSTAGQTRFSDLVGDYSRARQDVAANALAATNTQRANVNQNRNQLLAQNTAAANPNLAARSAVGSVGALTAAPTYSPLADIFASALNSIASYQSGANNRLPAGYDQFFAPGYYSNRSSGRVVS